ncbi:aldo/keto reductase [Thiobacillus sp.]|uniref:aldo/keto reductase n=1 Tax=Thiobacillus sp. TaxID=924 RepID=UPI00286E21A3|nr:aldo/keto reductase [Thiobacillus sp.]
MLSVNKLGLGTVQWGLRYGLANQNGITPPETVREILSEARGYGITILDTASLYGESEAVLGTNSLEEFKVVTKTPRFATPAITDEQALNLTRTFSLSLQRLSVTKVYGLLIHHADDLLVPGGEKLAAEMMALKETGAVEKIGVSVYHGDQIDAILSKIKPDLVQLPFSVLDQRLLLNGQLERMKNLGIEIHARSVFLQGLLLMPLNRVPPYFDQIRPLLARWHAAAEAQSLTPTQAALSFVRNIPYVDTVLVGAENLEQFRSCCVDFSVSAKFDASGLACHDPRYINPAQWNRA